MPSPNYSVVFWAPPAGATTAIAVGNVVLPSASDARSWVVATAANRNGRRSEGIAISATGGSGFGTFEILQSGTIDSTISGLAPSASRSLVRCSDAGTIERVGTDGLDPNVDDVIGLAEADGRVHLMFGLPFAS